MSVGMGVAHGLWHISGGGVGMSVAVGASVWGVAYPWGGVEFGPQLVDGWQGGHP